MQFNDENALHRNIHIRENSQSEDWQYFSGTSLLQNLKD